MEERHFNKVLFKEMLSFLGYGYCVFVNIANTLL